MPASRQRQRQRHVRGARTDDVVAIADDLVALHSTDPVTVYLSAAARMRTPALEPLAAVLYDDRTLIRHHAMRRTLWVFGHEAARLAHHATPAALGGRGIGMGWKQRGFRLDPEHAPFLFDGNGNGGPTAWADGRIVGSWVQRRDGTIAMRLLADVGVEARTELERHAHELESLLGPVRFSVRYPAPVQTELMA